MRIDVGNTGGPAHKWKQLLSTAPRRAREKTAHLLFEGRYGVDTAGRTYLHSFDLHSDERVYYVPANWLTLRRVLRPRDVSNSDVFIDLGSGKGRMVLEAARYPFSRVIGVELAEPLHNVARANVGAARMRRRCNNIQLICCDVLDYDIPDDVSVVFLNNPFRGAIFEQVIENLIASHDRRPRKIRIIYYNPTEHDYLMRTGRFVRERTVHRELRRSDNPFASVVVYALGDAG
jgi:16S rRNA G966 N2-methylase RsmD